MPVPPFAEPRLNTDLPLYPHLLQMVRTTATVVAGPSTLQGQIGALLYVAATVQVRTDTLRPRDREPCLVLDLNGLGLNPGYYEGRLVGSYQSLPVYAVGWMGLIGLTAVQLYTLTENLAGSSQVPGYNLITNLNNLTPCQLQTFIQLNTPQQQLLTSILTPTQIGTLIDSLTVTQIINLITGLSPPQLQILTNLPPPQFGNLVTALTPAQIGSLINPSGPGGLTPDQLGTLGDYPPADIGQIVGSLPPSKIPGVIGSGPGVPGPLLGRPGFPVGGSIGGGVGYLPTTGSSSVPGLAPIPIPGYLPAVVGADGTIYIWNGSWVPAGGGGSTPTSDNVLTTYSGTTDTTFATVFTKTNANGLHGSFTLLNGSVANSMTGHLTLTDWRGVVGVQTLNFFPSGSSSLNLDGNIATTIPTTYPPYTSIKLEVEDTTPGSHCAWTCGLSLVG